MLNKGENEVGLQEVTLQPESSLEEQSDCIKAFQGGFFSLVLEAKPLISNESVLKILFVCIWKNYFWISIFIQANISISGMKYHCRK